jgi:hypothetical protein
MASVAPTRATRSGLLARLIGLVRRAVGSESGGIRAGSSSSRTTSTPCQAYDRLAAGLPFTGRLMVRQTEVIAAVIDRLVLVWSSSEAEEWQGQVVFLPLSPRAVGSGASSERGSRSSRRSVLRWGVPRRPRVPRWCHPRVRPASVRASRASSASAVPEQCVGCPWEGQPPSQRLLTRPPVSRRDPVSLRNSRGAGRPRLYVATAEGAHGAS